MKKNELQNWRQYDTLLGLVILAFLLIYTYGLLFVAPYPGFYFNPSDGRVLEIYRPEPSSPELEVGDIIERVNQISFEAYNENKSLNLFHGMQKDQRIEIEVRREGERLVIPWIYPGFNRVEFFSRFFNIWWLAYIFWAIGMAAQLLIRPRDTQRRLFVALSYLTGMFLMLGSLSSYHVMMSAILLRVVAWQLLPVYLHFHWIFPASFRRIPPWLKIVFYVVFGAIALGELLRRIPTSLYFFAVILALGGSILLLLFHYILQPKHRREIRFLGFSAFLALFPVVLLAIISSGGRIPHSGPLVLLALPVLPGAYFYVLHRRRMGGLELRTNRAISLYVFLVLLGSVLLLAVGSTGLVDISREVFIFATVLTALLTTLIGILVFPAFQTFIERRLLGIHLPAQNMVEGYSARIVTSTSLPALLTLLEKEIFPSLLIRQYAFVKVVDSSMKILLSEGVAEDQLQEQTVMDQLASSLTEGPVALPVQGPPPSWVRFTLPLRIGSDLIGGWLFGRRDPDDHYPLAERPILQSLADQTAVALSNLLQTDRLRVMYEANIHRYEKERFRLARDLHDSLLNEMAAMLMRHEPASLPQEFQQSFDGLIVRLREIVKDLRPPMLMYGLKFALEVLGDNLAERSNDRVRIVSELHAEDDCRYPEIVENNLYRIVQEACENALKYSRAGSIQISGTLSPGRIDIQVADDGIGFKNDIRLELNDMVANRHYGLAGMRERAELIGAAIDIRSGPNQGTQIHVEWKDIPKE